MKRMTSMILTLCMIVTIIPIMIATPVDATTDGLTPLFKMQIQRNTTGDNSQNSITDELSNSNVDTTRGIDMTAIPNKGTAYTAYGEHDGNNGKTPYLTFGNNNENSGIRVPFKSGVNIADMEAITFETWVRAPYLSDGDSHSKAIAGFLTKDGAGGGNNSNAAGRAMRFRLNGHSTGYSNLSFYPDVAYAAGVSGVESQKVGVGNFKIDGVYDNQWIHLVVTRQWIDKEEDETGLGNWLVTSYLNGTEISPVTFNESIKTTYGDEYTDLLIGTETSGQAFHGDIATFNVYEGAMSASVAKANYYATRDKFYKIVPVLEETEFKNQNDDVIDDKTVMLADAESVAVEATITDCPQNFVSFLALYDENGMLIGISECKAGVQDEDMQSVISGTASKTEGTTIDKAVFYCWNATNKISPIAEPVSIGGKLKISGKVIDGDNKEITYLENSTGISGEINVSAGEPPKGLIAKLKLMRDAKAVVNKSQEVSFTGQKAEVNIPLGQTPQEGDELVLSVMNGKETIFSKRTFYENQENIVDVILVAGQSNAVGQGGIKDNNIKLDPSEPIYYGTYGNTNLDANNGNIGWNSALAKTWHEETGRTVLLVKAAWGGTGFPLGDYISTQPDWGSEVWGFWSTNSEDSTIKNSFGKNVRNCYAEAKELYNKAIKSIPNDKIIGRRVYFWNQGENENGYYDEEKYEAAFMPLHEKFITEFGSKAATDKTEDYPLQYGGILPVRSTSAGGAPIAGAKPDSLHLTGPRIAQYKLGNSKDNNIFIVADLMERWSSDSNIKAWFEEKYPNGYYIENKTIPTCWSEIMKDYVHYNQLALNEFGIEAAQGMLAHLRGEGAADDVVDGIDIITPSGLVHIPNGGEIRLPSTTAYSNNACKAGVIPVISASSGVEISSMSIKDGNAAKIVNGMIIPIPAHESDYSTLEIKYMGSDSEKTMNFRVYSPIPQESGAVGLEIAKVKDNRKAIYTLTTDDGFKATNQWLNTTLADIEEANELPSNSLKATMGFVIDYMGDSGMLTWDDAKALVATGRFGVANHSYTHPNLTKVDLSRLQEEINGARATLKEKFPNQKIVGFYTPGGQMDDEAKGVIMEQHFVQRNAGASENNSLSLLTEDGMYNIKSRLLHKDIDLPTLNGWTDTAISNGEWVVELWHATESDEGYKSYNSIYYIPDAIAESHLEYIAEKVKNGDLWMTTLDEAAVYTKQRFNTRLSLISQTDSEIEFSMISEKLYDVDKTTNLFDAELTVNITLPEGWVYSDVTATQNGASLDVKIVDAVKNIVSVNLNSSTNVVELKKN